MINEKVEILNELVMEDEQLYFIVNNLKSITVIGDDGKRYCAKNINVTNILKEEIINILSKESEENKKIIKRLIKTIDNTVEKW